MKKMICVFALCFVSPFSLADEAGVQMVLNGAHSKGFTVCGKEIRAAYKDGYEIRHVEVKLPFGVKDEAIIIVDTPSKLKFGWEGGVSSHIFRKINKQCWANELFSTHSNVSDNCDKVAERLAPNAKVVEQTDNVTWVRPDYSGLSAEADASSARNGASAAVAPMLAGGCRGVVFPKDMSK